MWGKGRAQVWGKGWAQVWGKGRAQVWGKGWAQVWGRGGGPERLSLLPLLLTHGNPSIIGQGPGKASSGTERHQESVEISYRAGTEGINSE